jgi:hypothetical protein
MPSVDVPSLVISLIAVAISAYGIGERRFEIRQAERLRFATIIDELNSLHLQHLQATADLTDGDITDAVNGRRELLASQGHAMLKKLRNGVTSPELRTLAHALVRAGYPVEAGATWELAVRTASGEGRTQSLFAHRGRAYYLFDQGHVVRARTSMRQAIEAIGSADDASIIHQIKTLKYWSEAELREDPAAPQAAALLDEARQAVTTLAGAHAQRLMRDFLA